MWLTSSFREARRGRRRAERRWRKRRLTVWQGVYKAARQTASQTKTAAKRKFFADQIESANNSRKLFSLTDELLGVPKSKPLPTNCPRDVLPQQFSDYFSDKVTKIRTELDELNAPPPSFTEYDGVLFSEFRPVTEKEIRDLILTSSPKTCILDPLPTSIVQEQIDVLVPVITNIINMSLTSGTVPKLFKTAVVTPLLKKMNLDTDNLKNYRPVSNLPFISKILERVVLKQCQAHLNDNDLFEVNQSAYRKNHSTETAVLSVVDELLSNIDKKLVSLVALLDLSAAFDTIDQGILLTRLKHSFGFHGTVLDWFTSYLSDRSQSVCIDNVMSASSPLTFGVPQGSVLGPVLFSLYTQPLSDVIQYHQCSFHKFADDTEISLHAKPESFISTQDSVQSCISDVLSWMNSNKLKLNPEKTEAMISGSRHRLLQTPSCTMSVNGTSISYLPSVKYLGVTLDCSLTMERHISNVCRSTFLALRRISSIRPFLSSKSTATLVHATVTSRLDYCNSSLSGIPSQQLSRLQRVQNNAVRLITKKRKHDHITPLLQQLHWLPISFRIQFKLAVLAFRFFDNSLPAYLSRSLSLYEPTRALRSSSDSRLLVTHTTSLKSTEVRAFSSSVPKVWNSLPADLRNLQTLSLFKSRLKTYLFKLAFNL